MSRPMQKKAKVILGLLLVAVLIGACFASVALYAKHEIDKPKFIIPAQPAPQALTTLLPDQASAVALANRLYADACAADDAQISLKTTVSTQGDAELPFDTADREVILYMLREAHSRIEALYPQLDGVIAADADLPLLQLSETTVTQYAVEPERAEDGQETSCVLLTLTETPDSIDANALTRSNQYLQIIETLSDTLTVEQISVTAERASTRLSVDRARNKLVQADVTRAYRVRAVIRLTDDYGALLTGQETAEIELPYETTRQIRWTHCGARFIDRAIAVNPGDRKTLPAEVTVCSGADKGDYTLTFTSSAPDVLTFDGDGVMTVERLCDDPVTVTLTLTYDGRTYTDTLTVYVTQWEVAADA